MSLLAEHLFNPQARERLEEDLRLLTEEGVRQFAIHLSSGGKDPDAKVYSKRDVEALIAIAMAVHNRRAQQRKGDA